MSVEFAAIHPAIECIALHMFTMNFEPNCESDDSGPIGMLISIDRSAAVDGTTRLPLDCTGNVSSRTRILNMTSGPPNKNSMLPEPIESPEPMQPSARSGQRLMSFSVSNLLLLVVIAALGLSTFLTWRQLSVIRPELEKLRAISRPLEIDDPDQAHLISLPTGDSMTWSWRVYLPEGYSYPLGLDTKQIPSSGAKANPGVTWGMFRVPPGEEVIVNARLRVTEKAGAIEFVVMQNGVSISRINMTMSASFFERLRDCGLITTTSADQQFSNLQFEISGHDGTQSFAPGEPIILVRIRPKDQQPDGSTTNRVQPSDGFSAWLIPVPNAAAKAAAPQSKQKVETDYKIE